MTVPDGPQCPLLSRPDRGERLTGAYISFRNQTPLTRIEAVHAFDILLDWQGLAVIRTDARHFRVISRSAKK